LHPKTQILGHFGDHYAQFGGESQAQFVDRVVNCAREIVDKHPNQSILAVSHAGALMTFLHAVEPDQAFESCPGNCAILVFDYEGSDFHFVKLIDPLTDQELVEF
ncbi:MAG: histidine phosphatase family protein, partial [Streptococcus salivarius]